MVGKTDFEGALEAAKLIREAATQLRSERSALQAKCVDLKAERESLLSLPVVREDAKQFILDTIDRIAAEFIEFDGWDHKFKRFAFPRGTSRRQTPRFDLMQPNAPVSPLTLRDIEQAEDGGHETLCSVLGSDVGSFLFGTRDNLVTSPSRIYFFFGDVIKAKIEEHFETLFPQYGVPDESSIEQRRARLSAIDRELIDVARRIKEIDGKLSEIAVSSTARVG